MTNENENVKTVKNDVCNRFLTAALTATCPPESKKDKNVTDEINILKNASSDAGNYSKRFMSKQFSKAIRQCLNRAKTHFKENTIKWINGASLLETKNYSDFMLEFEFIKNEFENLLSGITKDSYENEIKVRSHELGDMFDSNDYLPFNEWKARFSMELTIIPIADTSNFDFIGVSEIDTDKIKSEIEGQLKNQFGEVLNNLTEKLTYDVTDLADKIQNFEGRRLGTYKKASLTNIRELIASIQNFQDNENFNGLLADIDRILDIDAKDIKENPALAIDTSYELNKLVSVIDSWN